MTDATASDVTGTDSTATPAVAAPAPAAPATNAAAPAAAPAPADDSSLLTDEPQVKADDAKTDDKSGDAKKDDAKGAPEEYADFTLPDNVTMNPEVLSQFKTLAKEAGLSQEAAQKLVALGAGMQERTLGKLRETVDATAKEWATSSKADAEIGGVKFEETLGVAKKALDTFGTPELKTLLKETRLGSHPEVIRLLARAGKAISQDGFTPGRTTAAAKSAADVLYGSTTK